MTRMGRWILIVGIALLAAPRIWAAPRTAFKKEHQQAAESLDAERWTEAERRYRAILKAGPEDIFAPVAQFGLARALGGAGKEEEALKGLRLVLEVVARQEGEGKLSLWQGADAWGYAVHRERGRIHEGRREFAAAERAYFEATEALGNDPTRADLRAQVLLDGARCLVAQDKRKEAIALLTERVDELGAAEFAGMRAKYKAVMAKIYREMGEGDWAVTILEEIRNDPEIDPEHYAKALAMERGEEWKPKTRGETWIRRGPDYLAIGSESYEVQIALQPVGRNLFGANRYGWITRWFDLKADPFRTTNLSGLSDHPLFAMRLLELMERREDGWERIDGKRWSELSKTHDVRMGMQQGPSVTQNGSVEFEVLERSSVRVRTRTRHDRWPYERIEYTFYPNGVIHIGVSIDGELKSPPLRIETIGFEVARNSRVGWRDWVEGDWWTGGEFPAVVRTPYLVATSDPAPSFRDRPGKDILLFPSAPIQGVTRVVEEPLRYRKASVEFVCDRATPLQRFAFQLRLQALSEEPVAAARRYAASYQTPGTVTVENGLIVLDDGGDWDRDGFNESEGCYVVRGAAAATLQAGEWTREQPVLKFLEAGVDGIPDLFVNGRPAIGSAYNLARVGTDGFVVQWFGSVPEGGSIEFELK